MAEVPSPCTDFEWSVYDDATFAGLAALIPIPLVDWFFEEFFRRRMARGIARYRGKELPPEVGAELNRGEGCAQACLSLPVKVAWELVKRTIKKFLYFLSIKSATDRLSYYWHRAFLIDCMLLQGRLDDQPSARIAREAMARTLDATSTSPMLGLARSVVTSTRHVLRTVRKARRGEEDEEIAEKRSLIQRRWDSFRDHLLDVAARYNVHYEALEGELVSGEG